MQETVASTPIVPVVVEPRPGGEVSDVWLNRNVAEDVAEDGDGGTPIWRAEQVHGLVPGAPSVEEIEAAFSEHWERFEGGPSLGDRLAALEEQQRISDAALLEICDMIGGTL